MGAQQRTDKTMSKVKYINPREIIYLKQWLRFGQNKKNKLHHVFHDDDEISIGLCEIEGNFFIEEKKLPKNEICKKCLIALTW